MKRLLHLFSTVVLSSTFVLYVVACKTKDEYNIQVEVMKPMAGKKYDSEQLTKDAINEVMAEVKDDPELSKYRFSTVKPASYVNKLDQGTMSHTDNSIPDVFYIYFGKIKDFADRGFLLPLDKDEDGSNFIDEIGLSKSKVGKENNFAKGGFNRVYMNAKGTDQSNIYALPLSLHAHSGFFFKKDPASLELYKSLGLGEIVRVAPDGSRTIIDRAPIDNYDNVTFDFANDNNGKNEILKYGYISFNHLINAAMQAQREDKRINLFQLGIGTHWQVSFGSGQTYHKDYPNIKEKISGVTWERTNTEYLRNLSKIYQDLNYLNSDENLEEILRVPGSNYNWDSTLNHPGFKDSVHNYYSKLIDYAIMQGRYSHTKSFGYKEKGNQYYDRASGTDDVIFDTYQQLMLRGNTEDPIDTKMWILNSFGPEYAAWRLGLLNLKGIKISDFKKLYPEELDKALKNIDFAPIYKLGTGTGDLLDPSSWNNDPKTARAWSQAWTSGDHGDSIVVNNRLSKDKHGKNKITLIRKYIRKLVNNYMRDGIPNGVARWYLEAGFTSPIVGAITKLQEQANKGEIALDEYSSKYPNIKRMELNHLTLSNRFNEDTIAVENDFNKQMWVEPGVPTFERNLNDINADSPLAKAWTSLISEHGLLRWGARFENSDVWEDIIGLELSNPSFKNPEKYKRLRTEIVNRFIAFIMAKIGYS